jgi:purine nucleoside permease
MFSFTAPKRVLAILALAFAAPLIAATTEPVRVKVMVVSTFEVGADTGDQPGEYQFWVEREHLDTVIPFAFAGRHLRTNGKGVFAFICGGSTRCESSLMALILDPRFDFTHTYWIINGIAGVDPNKAGLATAAWAQWVIDGDDAYEVDSSEKERSWPYGVYPAGATAPNRLPEGPVPQNQMAYQVSPTLVQWAYNLTKDTVIPDDDGMKAYRVKFVGYPNAQKPPFVMVGDFVSSARYYYGTVMNKWADDWAKLWTNGRANYVMSADEDQGLAYALTEAAKIGKVDWNRVLFLRTASDYACAPPGMTAQENLQGGFPGFRPALESAYRVGSRVLHEITEHWDLYANTPPGSSTSASHTN